MSRQSDDSTMVSSSIALLQERFRQLEREREKREEKEMLNLFTDSDRRTATRGWESNKSTLQPEMILRHRPPPQDYSLSLELNSPGRHADFRATTPPSSTGIWPNGSARPSTSRSFDNSDVDTSLHL